MHSIVDESYGAVYDFLVINPESIELQAERAKRLRRARIAVNLRMSTSTLMSADNDNTITFELKIQRTYDVLFSCIIARSNQQSRSFSIIPPIDVDFEPLQARLLFEWLHLFHVFILHYSVGFVHLLFENSGKS